MSEVGAMTTPELKIYDRLRDRVEPVVFRDPGVLHAYICGPTVYGLIHVGNARPYWFALVLKRFCERIGLKTQIASNITDINDSIYRAARERGIPSAQLAREMTDAYIADTGALGLGRPDVEPLASETLRLAAYTEPARSTAWRKRTGEGWRHIAS